VSVFVDTSAWFAASNRKDRYHQRALDLMSGLDDLVISSFVVVETWLLLNSRLGFGAAEKFVTYIWWGAATLEFITSVDFDYARQMPQGFEDQFFSLVDRTSFALMQRLGISRVISFDDDFVIYRYGPGRGQAFEVLR
jgi:predicted nucleic acid-binding protein